MAVVAAYLHSLSLMALAALFFVQLRSFGGLDQRDGVRQFLRFSVLIGIAALVMLASGVLMLLAPGQSSAFYLRNPVFYIKLALFAAMILIAITPTRIMLYWHREPAALPDARLITLVKRYFIVEAILLLVIPLAASLSAHGIGLQASPS